MPHGAGSCALFQSTRPVRGGTYTSGVRDTVSKFQSTRPVRGGTASSRPRRISPIFQSTRPVRGGTALSSGAGSQFTISIHPPRAGRDVGMGLPPYTSVSISIHPPRAGRDTGGGQLTEDDIISIHPPRAGRDGDAPAASQGAKKFQSTRPVRGGTGRQDDDDHPLEFQSTRPVRGGTWC